MLALIPVDGLRQLREMQALAEQNLIPLSSHAGALGVSTRG